MYTCLIEGIMERGGREALIPFSCVARKIWFRRNSVVHGGAFNHPIGLIQEMQRSVEEYTQANEKTPGATEEST